MSQFLEFIKNQVLLLDGAMGTQIQGADLKVEEDYWGQENCSEILNLSRPDFIRNVHMKYLSA
ncbi:MAG: homocysteine S-methyltransferase family protein, partial [Rickettsiales bacterium]|nr:homocysteine S-methyltransferase family protein [Rickettsiales bacterium]